jgi:hypothetical protein
MDTTGPIRVLYGREPEYVSQLAPSGMWISQWRSNMFFFTMHHYKDGTKFTTSVTPQGALGWYEMPDEYREAVETYTEAWMVDHVSKV